VQSGSNRYPDHGSKIIANNQALSC